MTPGATNPLAELASAIKSWALELGFNDCGITGTELHEDEQHLLAWLNNGYHGEMHYMTRHGLKRSRPALLEPGTLRVISVSMNYLDDGAQAAGETLADPQRAYVSRYALGRDYHKLMRQRLQKLARRIEQQAGTFGYRAFVDSAPVLEKALARESGLGWIGKHSNLLTRRGSWFFLGELYTDLPLPADPPFEQEHCGRCTRCIDDCPTGAIIAPYQVDARRCISYLTIEYKGPIPMALRPLMGNRIYGCDDCQLVCPWNRHTAHTAESDFRPRHGLDSATLLSLLAWDRQTFLERLAGSPIRRIGHECWQRNIVVALGNALTAASAAPLPDIDTIESIGEGLNRCREGASPMLIEHIDWALEQNQRTD